MADVEWGPLTVGESFFFTDQDAEPGRIYYVNRDAFKASAVFTKARQLGYSASARGLLDLIEKHDRNWLAAGVKALVTPMFTGGRTMNEQEYEKSIARPVTELLLPSGTITTDLVGVSYSALKAEREFSRGVWDKLKRLRTDVNQSELALGGARQDAIPKPVPDAPKPDCCSDTYRAVLAAMVGSRLSEHEANGLIEQIRRRTVKEAL